MKVWQRDKRSSPLGAIPREENSRGRRLSTKRFQVTTGFHQGYFDWMLGGEMCVIFATEPLNLVTRISPLQGAGRGEALETSLSLFTSALAHFTVILTLCFNSTV